MGEKNLTRAERRSVKREEGKKRDRGKKKKVVWLEGKGKLAI